MLIFFCKAFYMKWVFSWHHVLTEEADFESCCFRLSKFHTACELFLQESSDLPVALLLAQHKDRSTQLEMQLEKPRSTKPVTFSTGIKMVSHILIAVWRRIFRTMLLNSLVISTVTWTAEMLKVYPRPNVWKCRHI